MDISGQQQMGVTSRIVQLDLDENQKPVNMALSSVLFEVPFASPFLSTEKHRFCMWQLFWSFSLEHLLQHV